MQCPSTTCRAWISYRRYFNLDFEHNFHLNSENIGHFYSYGNETTFVKVKDFSGFFQCEVCHPPELISTDYAERNGFQIPCIFQGGWFESPGTKSLSTLFTEVSQPEFTKNQLANFNGSMGWTSSVRHMIPSSQRLNRAAEFSSIRLRYTRQRFEYFQKQV